MVRSISKQPGETMLPVLKNKGKATVGRICRNPSLIHNLPRKEFQRNPPVTFSAILTTDRQTDKRQ